MSETLDAERRLIVSRYVKLNSRSVPLHLSSRPEQRQAEMMATIYTSCPNTGRELSTGIEIEPESFMALPAVITRVRCPYCGEQHNWSKYNVVLREVVRAHPQCKTLRER